MTLAFAYRTTNTVQLVRGTIAHLPKTVDQRIDVIGNGFERNDIFGQSVQRGIDCSLARANETADRIDLTQRTSQQHSLFQIEERTLDTHLCDQCCEVAELLVGKFVLHLNDRAHLVSRGDTILDHLAARRETMLVEFGAGGLGVATLGNQCTYAVETYFRLKICGIDHNQI